MQLIRSPGNRTRSRVLIQPRRPGPPIHLPTGADHRGVFRPGRLRLQSEPMSTVLQHDRVVPVDRYGRRIDYLRVSVTDRCNLRCVYCMPIEDLVFTPGAQMLTA